MAELDAAIPGATHTDIGGLSVDEASAGDARIKRIVYPPGWKWSTDMAPVTGTTSCQHVHVGFIAQGAMDISYDDGRTIQLRAPGFAVLEPGHDGWVVGDESVVFIQVDVGTETQARFGL